MRRVCFFGMYPYPDAPAFDAPEDMEIWVVNEAHRSLPEGRKPSRVFQMHPRDWREEERTYLNSGMLPLNLDPNCFGRNEEHVEYLRTCGVPVYGQQQWEDIPTSVAYPILEVQEAVGIPLPPHGFKRLWASSSFGYMAALLITEILAGDAVSELHLWGIELPLGTSRERLWEWPNLAYYLGLAAGLGVKIVLPPSGTSLLSAPWYAVGGGPFPGAADHWFYAGPPGIVTAYDGTYYLGTQGWEGTP